MTMDLNNFKVNFDADGFVMMDGDGDMVLLENLRTGAITKRQYADVSAFYNLPETSIAYVNCTNNLEQSSIGSHFPDELQPGPSNNNNGSVKWAIGPTKYLLEVYAELSKCVGPLQKFRTKKLMWAQIASNITSKFGMNVNAIQVETRYKCVMKSTKKAIENNNTIIMFEKYMTKKEEANKMKMEMKVKHHEEKMKLTRRLH